MNAQAYTYIDTRTEVVKERRRLFAKKKAPISAEDAFILSTLEKLKKDLDAIHRSLDAVTDPILIDSFIYEMNAINMRFKYYLQQCKDRGLIGDMF